MSKASVKTGLIFLLIVVSSSVGLGEVYRYDSLNRLTQVTYDDGTKIVYSYDASGNRGQRVISVLSDFDGDGDVDFADLSTLAAQWLDVPGEPSADIALWPNTDNIINLLDMAVFANDWLSD
jgi:YD repeat-containing protein